MLLGVTMMSRDGSHRIRTNDPDFFSHPKVLRCMAEDPLAVLLLLGIRTPVVDDAGRFRSDPLHLKVEIAATAAAFTEQSIQAMLERLERHRLIHLYRDGEEQYGIVHDWLHWQKIDKPTASRLPAPPSDICRCCSETGSELSATGSDLSTTGRRGLDRIGKEGKGRDVVVTERLLAALRVLRTIEGYPFNESDDARLMSSLADAYPAVDLAAELRRIQPWRIAKGVAGWRSVRGARQFVRNWLAGTGRYRTEPQPPADDYPMDIHAQNQARPVIPKP